MFNLSSSLGGFSGKLRRCALRLHLKGAEGRELNGTLFSNRLFLQMTES